MMSQRPFKDADAVVQRSVAMVTNRFLSPSPLRFTRPILPAAGGEAPERPHPDRGLPDQAEAAQAAVGPGAAFVLLQSLTSAGPPCQPGLLPHQAARLLPPDVRLAAEVSSAHHHWFPHQGGWSLSDSVTAAQTSGVNLTCPFLTRSSPPPLKSLKLRHPAT